MTSVAVEPEFSREAARILASLQLEPGLYFPMWDAVQQAGSYDDLPAWAKKIWMRANDGKAWTPEEERLHPRGHGGRFARKFDKVSDLFREVLPQAHIVGGAVRDTLLGHEPKDEDFVVPGMGPREIRDALRPHGRSEDLVVNGRDVGVRFYPDYEGAPPEGVEVVPPRKEVSTGPSRHDFDIVSAPDIPLSEDAKRRDFTINALYQPVSSQTDAPRYATTDQEVEALLQREPFFREPGIDGRPGVEGVRDSLEGEKLRAHVADALNATLEPNGETWILPDGTKIDAHLSVQPLDETAARWIILADFEATPTGTGAGSRFMEAVKSYADQHNLGFEVHKATTDWYERFPWLEANDGEGFRHGSAANFYRYGPWQQQIVDPTGHGLQDLKDGLLRTTSADSFRDDPLRMMRAIRFMSKLDFDLAPDTRKQMEEHADAIEHVSGERIQAELDKTLMGPHPRKALQMAIDTGLLQHIIPEFRDVIGYSGESRYHANSVDQHILAAVQKAADDGAPLEVRLALLFHDLGKPQAAYRTSSRVIPSPLTDDEQRKITAANVANAVADKLGGKVNQTPTSTTPLRSGEIELPDGTKVEFGLAIVPGYYEDRRRWMVLHNFAVEPRRAGTGSRVMEALREYADETGLGFTIHIAAGTAIPFYERFSWLERHGHYGFDYRPWVKPGKLKFNGNPEKGIPDHQDVGADIAREVMRRLRYPIKTQQWVESLVRGHMADARIPATPLRARQFMAQHGDHAIDILTHRRADLQGKEPLPEQIAGEIENLRKLEALIHDQQHMPTRLSDLAVNGRDLMEIGFQAGPMLGQALHELLRLVIAHPERNTKEELLQVARRMRPRFVDVPRAGHAKDEKSVHVNPYTRDGHLVAGYEREGEPREFFDAHPWAHILHRVHEFSKDDVRAGKVHGVEYDPQLHGEGIAGHAYRNNIVLGDGGFVQDPAPSARTAIENVGRQYDEEKAKLRGMRGDARKEQQRKVDGLKRSLDRWKQELKDASQADVGKISTLLFTHEAGHKVGHRVMAEEIRGGGDSIPPELRVLRGEGQSFSRSAGYAPRFENPFGASERPEEILADAYSALLHGYAEHVQDPDSESSAKARALLDLVARHARALGLPDRPIYRYDPKKKNGVPIEHDEERKAVVQVKPYVRDGHVVHAYEQHRDTGKRLVLKGDRKLTRLQVEKRMQQVADDVAKFFGTPSPKTFYEPEAMAAYGVDARTMKPKERPHGGMYDTPEIWYGLVMMEKAQDPEFGVFEFRKLAHEAIHASVSGDHFTHDYPHKVEEGAAEVLSLYYWSRRGQPFDHRDATRRDGKWTEPGIPSLANSVVYRDQVMDLLKRAASRSGWNRKDILSQVYEVMRGTHNERIKFRDSTRSDVALPEGVHDVVGLIEWLLGEAPAGGKKEAVPVHAYIREGHLVHGYTREQETSLRDAFDLPKSGKLRKAAIETLDAIDTVLRLPPLPKIPLRSTQGKNHRGGYRRDGIETADGSVQWRPGEIKVSVRGGNAKYDEFGIYEPHLTLGHEIAHFLDNVAFGHDPSGIRSESTAAQLSTLTEDERREVLAEITDPERRDLFQNLYRDIFMEGHESPLTDWMRAVKQSPEYGELHSTTVLNYGTQKYLLRTKELFARSVAQWLAIRTGQPQMLGALRAWQSLPEKHMVEVEDWMGRKRRVEASIPTHMRYRQWSDENFAPIGEALDNAFRKMGWLR